AAVWMAGELARWLADKGLDVGASPVSAAALAALIRLVEDGKINRNTGKRVLQQSFETGKEPSAIVAEQGLEQVSDTGAIDAAIAGVLDANAAEVQRYRAGEEKVFGFLVGQVMKSLKGQGNPSLINDRLRALLTG
ncbi:MAG: Asp-tRNA(Asn)/Glu-tRNA(Gln) amidotransferase subunit GatB, partial [Actinomycetota bacterium]